MAARSLNDSTLASSSRLASAHLVAGRTRAARTVRWGAAVVEPARRGANQGWQDVNGRRSAHSGAVRGAQAVAQVPSARPAVSQAVAADAVDTNGSFTQNRIRHAFELFGACMMIVTFLALAMFA